MPVKGFLPNAWIDELVHVKIVCWPLRKVISFNLHGRDVVFRFYDFAEVSLTGFGRKQRWKRMESYEHIEVRIWV